jgi:hypothetical protein
MPAVMATMATVHAMAAMAAMAAVTAVTAVTAVATMAASRSRGYRRGTDSDSGDDGEGNFAKHLYSPCEVQCTGLCTWDARSA